MFKQGIKFLLIFCLVFGLSAPLYLAEAQANAGDATKTGLEKTADIAFDKKIPFKDAKIPGIIGTLIGAVLAFLGVVFFILMIYGGLLWMTARGNQEAVTKAKDLLQAAIIGLIIVLSAYAITAFIGRALTSTP